MSRREDIDSSVWSDPDFAELTPEAKLVYLWSFTNDRCNMAGIYKVSVGAIVFETSLVIDRVNDAIEELAALNFLSFDGRWLWVKARVKYLRNRTQQIAVSISNTIDRLEGHEFAEAFVQRYGGYDWLAGHLNLNRGSDEPQSRIESGSREPQGQGQGLVVVVRPSSNDGKTTTELTRELFAYWQRECNHPLSKPTKERLAKIRARLNEDYSPEDIATAIDGARRGAYVDDHGKRFDDIELICRNASKLELFISRATATPPAPKGDALAERTAERAARIAASGLEAA